MHPQNFRVPCRDRAGECATGCRIPLNNPGRRPTPQRSTSTDLRRGSHTTMHFLAAEELSDYHRAARRTVEKAEPIQGCGGMANSSPPHSRRSLVHVTSPGTKCCLPWHTRAATDPAHPRKITRMAHDWLLVETLGAEPAVVAQGRQLKNLVPITTFLRRSPYLSAVRTAIAETVQTGQSLTSITTKRDRVIRTEPVVMSDGRVHGVHVWTGPADAEPSERPIPGPLKWDLTLGVATDTRESLANSGKNPEVEVVFGRAFAEDLPSRELNPNEARVLALAVKAKPDQTLCSTWDLTDWQGNPIRIGFVVHTALEPQPDGREHLVARAMNWRAELKGPMLSTNDLARRILQGLAEAGVHRALVDLNTWTLLKWLDEPSPFYDWRGSKSDKPKVHPDDEHLLTAMTKEFVDGPASRVLRMRGHDADWVPVHVTVNRVELEPETFAGLVALRLPTDDELVAAGLPAPGDTT